MTFAELFMKYSIIAALVLVQAGCTTISLTRHSATQVDSVADLRYQVILDNLAQVADDPTRLPSVVGLGSGTVFVQDQGSASTTITWPYSVGSVATNPSFNRQISQNWSLDPTLIPEKLEAVRAACQWAVGGPQCVKPASMSLLIRPQDAPVGPERHYGIADQLAQLPPGWLGCGKRCDVPACARYQSHCGQTWVWVTPENEKYLTGFTIAVQNVLKVNVNSPTLFHAAPLYSPVVFKTADTSNPEGRMRFTVQMVVNPSGHLVPDQPYVPWRLDNSFSDSALRSAIGAAGISSVTH
jgi:hypothetical protein